MRTRAFYLTVALLALAVSGATQAQLGIPTSAPAPVNANAASDGAAIDAAASIATDGAGTWIAFWSSSLDPDGTLGSDYEIYFARSTDDGGTWSGPELLSTNGAVDAAFDLQPRATTDGSGNWIVVWYASQSSTILFAQSDDNGASWGPTRVLHDVSGNVGAVIDTDGLGTWVAAWDSSDSLGGTVGFDGDILFSRSTDNGDSWSPPQPINSSAASDGVRQDSGVSLRYGGSGVWIAAWASEHGFGSQNLGSDWDIVFARSTDGGVTWSSSLPVNTDAAKDSLIDLNPNVASDGAGNWVVVWEMPESIAVPGTSFLRSARSSDGLGWSSPQVMPVNAPPTAQLPFVASDGDGTWIAAWADQSGTVDIWASKSVDNGATWSSAEALNPLAASHSVDYWFPRLAVESPGKWMAVWTTTDSLAGTIGSDEDVVFSRIFEPSNDTWVVDGAGGGDFLTIQAAIDAADIGDEIFVRCGDYFENVVMRSGIDLRGEGAHCTTIDANDSGDVVRLPTIREPTTLEGFTLRRGGSMAGSLGAGVYGIGGSPTITRNVIADNGAAGNGLGIYLRGLTDATDAPVITRNIIRDNVHCCSGGGIALLHAEGATISSNLIVGNSAYYGGGLYVYGGTSDVVDNTVVGNDGWVGGGMAILTGVGATRIANNAVIDNTAVIYAGALWGGDAGSLASNNHFGNTPDDWWDTGDQTGVNGNISADPGFVDPDAGSFAGFQPASSSPMVDAGSLPDAVALDLRGVARPLDGDADGVALPDIGARENEGITGVRFQAGLLRWDGAGALLPFNVYRGSLDTLRSTGVYTQDPSSVPDAKHFCGVASTVGDHDVPASGEVFFYLVAAVGAVEGGLGLDSELVARPATLACTP